MAKNASTLRIRQVRSLIGRSKKQHEVLRTLGLRRIGQVVERPDNAAVRGAVRLLDHLVVLEDAPVAAAAPKPVKVTTPSKPKAKAAKAEPKAAEAEPKAAKKTAAKKTAKKKAAKKKTGKTAKKKKTTKKKSSGGKS